jgi:hypothetical protein
MWELGKLKKARNTAIKALAEQITGFYRTGKVEALIAYLKDGTYSTPFPGELKEIMDKEKDYKDNGPLKEVTPALRFLKQEFESALGGEKSGLGEVWDIKIFPKMTDLQSLAEMATQTPDLLAPIMDGRAQAELKNRLIEAAGGIDNSPEKNERFDNASVPVQGGIDIQNIDVQRKAEGAGIKFNDDAVRAVIQNGFNGFTPVIINMTPIENPLAVMGIK